MAKATRNRKSKIEVKEVMPLNWSVPGLAHATVEFPSSQSSVFRSLFVVIAGPDRSHVSGSFGGTATPNALEIEKLENGLRNSVKDNRKLGLVLDNRSEDGVKLKFSITFKFLMEKELIVQPYSFELDPDEDAAFVIPVNLVEE